MDRWKPYQTKPRQSRRVAWWAVHEVHRWRRGHFSHGSAEAWACAGAILALQFDIDNGPAIIPHESSCSHSESLSSCCTTEDRVRDGTEVRQPPRPHQQIVLRHGLYPPTRPPVSGATAWLHWRSERWLRCFPHICLWDCWSERLWSLPTNQLWSDHEREQSQHHKRRE